MFGEMSFAAGILLGGLLVLLGCLWHSRRRHDADLLGLQSALRARQFSEERLEMALEASDAALWEWHIAEKRFWLSDRYFRQLGYEPHAFEAQVDVWRGLVHPDDWDGTLAVVKKHLKQPVGVYINEYRMRDASGQWRWMMARGRVVRSGPNGEPLLMVGTHIDVHQSKEQQRALMESRERFQKIYETTPDAMGITRIEDGLYLDVNSGFEAVTGYSRQEVMGRTSAEVGIWADADQRVQLMAEFKRAHQVDSMELLARNKAGQLVVGLMSVRRLEVDGEACMLFIFRDITERRRLQQDADAARAEMAAAAAASRAKTEFLSRMSHELRTPLNAVLGFAQLLQATAKLDERANGQVDGVLQAGWHLLNLINDVLDIARIESGHLQLELQPIELQPVLVAALDLVQGSAAVNGLAIELPDEAAMAVGVMADPVRLRQVLVNLLSNAIKYNRRGGQVSLHCSTDAQHLNLQVSDTGIGMSTQQMAHLFEPFNRLGRERGSIEGTGVGLVLTRYLVELMGGELSVGSSVNVGTTVTLRLRLDQSLSPDQALPAAVEPGDPNPSPRPKDEPQPAQHEVKSAASPAIDGGPQACVLYIEDNDTNQLIVREMLAPWPQVKLHLADDGQTGLRLAAELHPDLILLDMRLPDLDGLQVLRRLKADPRLAAITVVALSASAMPDDVARARQYGALEYWTKPLQLDRFLDDVLRVLG